MVIMDTEHKDCILRALNEAGLAKHALLNGGNKGDVISHLDACLSWSFPLIGRDHPMFNVVDPALQCVLLDHEDTNHQGQSS